MVADGDSGDGLLMERVVQFCLNSDADALGIFRIPSATLSAGNIHPDVAPAMEIFLPRLPRGDAMSRGDHYYDVRSALLAWVPLVTACRALDAHEDASDRRIALALYENVFNVVAAVTFAYWEHCCDEPEHAQRSMPVLRTLLDALPELAALYLGAAVGRDLASTPPSVDWPSLAAIGAGVPRRWRMRTLREFDNKARVLNEVLYLRKNVRSMWPFNVALFPLYGALSIAAYFSALERFLVDPVGAGIISPLLVRIGLYDRGSATYRTPHGLLEIERLVPAPWVALLERTLRDSRVLIADDNAATGRTLRACRELVLGCGGVPLTRSAETSWELLDGPGHHGPFDGVDLPGLRTNMSNALHSSLVDLLLRRQWARYAASIDLVGRTDLTPTLQANYRRAIASTAMRPTQRASVEHEWVHACRMWREPDYRSSTPAYDCRQMAFWSEGLPDAVWPWALDAPVSNPVADHTHAVHVGSPPPQVRVVADNATARAATLAGAAVEALEPGREGAWTDAPLVVGERCLDTQSAALLVRALQHESAVVLVLAQPPAAAALFPFRARIEEIPANAPIPISFTTAHHALPSLPRHRILGVDNVPLRPSAVFTRLGTKPWATEVAIGVIAPDGSLRGTVVGAQRVGCGLLLVCQLPLIAPVLDGHSGARALLADLLRWATEPRTWLPREDIVLADGRAMSFYPIPGR